MPLPARHKGESQDAFVARFMASAEARDEFPDQDQRLAVAFQKSREHALEKARTRIVKAEVKRLSLCRQGKNGLRTLYKSDGSFRLETLCKAIDEGTLLAVVYSPELEDEDGHVADAAVCRQMLHTLMRNGAELDIEHDGKVLAKSSAYVAEAFTVQRGDSRFQDWRRYDGAPAGDLTGAAAVQIHIDDPALRASRLRGEWDGISLFGTGEGVPERIPIRKSALQEDTMTPEQLKQITDAFQAGIAGLQVALVKSVADAVKPPASEPIAAPPAVEASPKFVGDPTKVEDLETFEKAVRAFEFRKAVTAGTMTADQIAALRASLSEQRPSDAEADIKAEDGPEVRKLKYDLFKAQRRSNAPAKGQLAHEQTQAALDLAEGLELSKSINGDGKAPAFAWNVH